MTLPRGADFNPPWPLRSGHIQTMLSSSGVRRFLLPNAAHKVREGAQDVMVEGGPGIRLSGAYTEQRTGKASRGLAVLFHGWEGSVDSTYVLQTGSRLLEDGWDVFRLNFRDHGDSHGLNEALFHSCRIDEVVTALGEIARMFPAKAIGVAGFSLGGNFALRAATSTPTSGAPARSSSRPTSPAAPPASCRSAASSPPPRRGGVAWPGAASPRPAAASSPPSSRPRTSCST